jgi:hypothetical protein
MGLARRPRQHGHDVHLSCDATTTDSACRRALAGVQSVLGHTRNRLSQLINANLRSVTTPAVAMTVADSQSVGATSRGAPGCGRALRR